MSIKKDKSLTITLILSIIIALILLFIKNRFLSKIPEISVAEPKPHQPQNIKITNLSDNSFSVSWLTDKPIQKSTITYYKKNSKPITLKGQETLPLKIHQIDIYNLQPQSAYFFTIFSEKETFMNNDKPFEAKTLKTTEKPPEPPFIITGSVKNRDGNPQPNALVFFGLNNQIAPLSVWTNEKGNFLLTLNNARNKSNSNYFSPQPGQTGRIMVETEEISYTKSFAIEKNLDLLITPTMEAKTASQPDIQVAKIKKQSWWKKIKALLKISN